MASKLKGWRERIERGLAAAPEERNPKAGLLARVEGPVSSEFSAVLEQPSQPAAVLLGLIERSSGLQLLLTERARHLPHHPGQISFPGGRIDAVDTDPIDAALREADEEVGLDRQQVRILGRLGPQLTGTGFCIHPVVGWVDPGFRARPDPGEVRSVFEVPLEHLLEPAHRRRGTRERWGTRFLTDEYSYRNYSIWGATAAILTRFIEVIDGKSVF